MRYIVKARLIGGVVCMTIPKEIAKAAGIEPNDRLLIEAKQDGTLTVNKEERADD